MRYLCIASCGFDSEANRIANEAKRVKGPIVYAYAALRALAAWKPATFTLTLDGERVEEVTGYSVAAANTKAYGGGMIAAPTAVPDDGLLEVGRERQRLEASLPARARPGLQGRASRNACEVEDVAGGRGADRGRPPVLRLRRRRPGRRAPRHDPHPPQRAPGDRATRLGAVSTPPATGPGFRAKVAIARAAGNLSRRSGRGGGTTLPGRMLLRMAPDAIERLGSRLTDGLDPDQRHQRQDHDRRDARVGPPRRPGALPSTTAPART